jgi:hypothetical protein
MPVRLSAAFYKATIDKFTLVKGDPIAFPVLLSFLEMASQSAALMREAKDVVSDDEKFRNFYQKTRDSLPPNLVQIIQKQEEEIREKLWPAIEAEMRHKNRVNELEAELRLRKEYEVHAKSDSAIIDHIVLSRLETQQDIKELKKQNAVAAKHDRIHKYLGYAVGVAGLTVSIIGWPSIWNKIMGQSSDPPAPLNVRLASSGQCLSSDVRVEVKKDGMSTLPSSGSVCLVLPAVAPKESGKESDTPHSPFVGLPYGDPCGPFGKKNWDDIFNDGETSRLFKEDGSSIFLHMPKITSSSHAKTPKAHNTHKRQGEPSTERHIWKHHKRPYHQRCP